MSRIDKTTKEGTLEVTYGQVVRGREAREEVIVNGHGGFFLEVTKMF